jgi:hypothetical protein
MIHEGNSQINLKRSAAAVLILIKTPILRPLSTELIGGASLMQLTNNDVQCMNDTVKRPAKYSKVIAVGADCR